MNKRSIFKKMKNNDVFHGAEFGRFLLESRMVASGREKYLIHWVRRFSELFIAEPGRQLTDRPCFPRERLIRILMKSTAALMPYNRNSRRPPLTLRRAAIRTSIGGWLQWTKTLNGRGVRLARLLKNTSLIIFRIIPDTLKELKIKYPEPAKTHRRELQSIREILAGRKGEETG